jgi:predicted metal-dependent hydrolase
MPETEDSRVFAEYQRGLSLAREGSYFEAHEALEAAWRACADDERDFFQGLVHVVVSSYQRGRGRPVATERQRLKAIKRLGAYTPSHRGLDVAALLLALDRSEPDVREQLVESVPQPEVLMEEEQQTEDDQRGA